MNEEKTAVKEIAQPNIITRRELARRLSLSPRSIDTMQRRKMIPVIKLSPRCARFNFQEVLRALSRFTVKDVK